MSELVTIDREALKRDAERLLHGSPLWAKIQGGLILDFKSVGTSAQCLGDLVLAAVASVEVVKANVKEMGGDDALDLALELLDDAVRFRGVLAPIDAVDRPVLHFFIEVALAAWRGKDWLVVARSILAIA